MKAEGARSVDLAVSRPFLPRVERHRSPLRKLRRLMSAGPST